MASTNIPRSILTADDLINIKHTVLTIERQEIARNIDPKRFFGHLRAKYVFDETDCDEIRSVSSRVGSAEVFVDTLKRKGGRGYDEFCNALMNDKTQMFLLQRLTQTLELLRAKVIERKTEKNMCAQQMAAVATNRPLAPVQQFSVPTQLPASLVQQYHHHQPLMHHHSLPHNFHPSEQGNPQSNFQLPPNSAAKSTMGGATMPSQGGTRHASLTLPNQFHQPNSLLHQQSGHTHHNQQYPDANGAHKLSGKVQPRQLDRERQEMGNKNIYISSQTLPPVTMGNPHGPPSYPVVTQGYEIHQNVYPTPPPNYQQYQTPPTQHHPTLPVQKNPNLPTSQFPVHEIGHRYNMPLDLSCQHNANSLPNMYSRGNSEPGRSGGNLGFLPIRGDLSPIRGDLSPGPSAGFLPGKDDLSPVRGEISPGGFSPQRRGSHSPIGGDYLQGGGFLVGRGDISPSHFSSTTDENDKPCGQIILARGSN